MQRNQFRPTLEQCERRDLASLITGSFNGTERAIAGGNYAVSDVGTMYYHGASLGYGTLNGQIRNLGGGHYTVTWTFQSGANRLLLQGSMTGLSGVETLTVIVGVGQGTQTFGQYIPNAGNTTNTMMFM